jgi:hypothetical protein
LNACPPMASVLPLEETQTSVSYRFMDSHTICSIF